MVDVLGSKYHYVSKTSQQYPFFTRDVVVLFGNGPITMYTKEWMLVEVSGLKVTRVIRDGACEFDSHF